MALGGGTFLTQNKILPGAYINFVSASRASSTISDRGVATMPLELDWGMDDAIFAVTSEDFRKNSLKIFGYPSTHEKLKGLRDLFCHIKKAYFYKLNSGGAKAANIYATSLYNGTRGNAIKIVIEAAENSTEQNKVYDVSTFLESTCVDVQTVSQMSDLKQNDFVKFITSATIALTAGMPLTAGNDGTVEDAAYQVYLDKVECYSFNVMGCLSDKAIIHSLFINFTKRLRNTIGAKFQCVLFRPASPDFEGIIGVENGLVSDKTSPVAVYWITGAEAGCEISKSLSNSTYDGEYEFDTDYTQADLKANLIAGKLLFHRVNDEVRVLEDVNTFTCVTQDKSADFSSNQTIRILDQIGNDIAALFNSKYLGKVPNDNAGRISLWNDIVTHHQQLQNIRVIENFSGDKVTVAPGEGKKAVVVTDCITPVNCLSQLYMTVIVQ